MSEGRTLTSSSGVAISSSLSPSQRPSYFDYLSTSGLHPCQNTFDEQVIKKLSSELDLLNETYASGSAGSADNAASEEEKLKTFLRIRPFAPLEGTPVSSCSVQIKNDKTVLGFTNFKANMFQDRVRKQTEFKFTKVLGPECGQSAIFEECVTPIIDKFMKHENCLIFSYGATNSGKTYTMQGYGTDYGIIPRTLDAIFGRINDRQYKVSNIRPHLYQAFQHLSPQDVECLIEKREKIIAEANIKNELMNSYRLDKSSGSSVDIVGGHVFDQTSMYANTLLYSVWVSFAELYNERVYDLLDNSTIGKNKRRKELKLLQDRNGFVYIKDLTELPVTSDEEAYKLFLAGKKNLQFAATQMNQHSSRSHSFFTLRVVSIGIGEAMVPYPKTVHRMTFCDLAGMERANQTENKGGRLQESGNINNSLIVLLRVIRVLRERQLQNSNMIETVPFRESKLTHIFKSYLTSSTHICMLVNVNPDPAVADSTFQVLQNSAVASNVVVFRPIDVNVTAQPTHVPAKYVNKGLTGKPPLPPKKEVKKSVEKAKLKRPAVDDSESSSQESHSDGEDYQIATVVAPKTILQRLKILETENAHLRMCLEASEREKAEIAENMVKMMNEERLEWRNRYQEVTINAQNFNRRRLSLMKHQLSPGSKCGRCVPPTADMEDIDETSEEEEDGQYEEEDEEEETGDSDKEN